MTVGHRYCTRDNASYKIGELVMLKYNITTENKT